MYTFSLLVAALAPLAYTSVLPHLSGSLLPRTAVNCPDTEAYIVKLGDTGYNVSIEHTVSSLQLF